MTQARKFYFENKTTEVFLKQKPSAAEEDGADEEEEEEEEARVINNNLNSNRPSNSHSDYAPTNWKRSID